MTSVCVKTYPHSTKATRNTSEYTSTAYQILDCHRRNLSQIHVIENRVSVCRLEIATCQKLKKPNVAWQQAQPKKVTQGWSFQCEM